jgi:hypothetical protein
LCSVYRRLNVNHNRIYFRLWLVWLHPWTKKRRTTLWSSFL